MGHADTWTISDIADSWRAEIIAEFRLRGAERCAAASPSPGFPQIMESVISRLATAPPGPWIDLGGGLGGAASWIERTTGREVSVFDLSLTHLRAARHLFPELLVVGADARHLPIRDSSVGVAIVGGLVSLLDDVGGLLAEAARIVTPRGLLVVTDLWAPGPSANSIGPNTFHSLEDFTYRADEAGLGLTHLAVADVTTGWWSSAADQVHIEIVDRHRGEPGFEEWERDHRRTRRVLQDGLAIPAGVVMARD